MKSRVIYTAGVWDLLHWGHIVFLEEAKKLGDYLIVGVHLDEVASSYKRKPIMSFRERMIAVNSVECVDEVMIALVHKDVNRDFFDKHNIYIQVHSEMPEKDKLWMHKYQLENKVMKYIPYTDGISTTEIIKRCKDTERYEISFLDLETLDPTYSANVIRHLEVLKKYDNGNPDNIKPFKYYEEFHDIRQHMKDEEKNSVEYSTKYKDDLGLRQTVTLYERMKVYGYGDGPFRNNFMWAGKRKNGSLRPHGSHRVACLLHMYRTKHPKAQRCVMVCVDKERKDKLNEG